MKQEHKKQLIDSLLHIFNHAKSNAEKALLTAPPVKGDAPSDNASPQVCAFLLSTGQIIAGVALQPLSYSNLDGDDPVRIANDLLSGLPNLQDDYEIVAGAMTTTTNQTSGKPEIIDLALYEQSLSELPHLKADKMLLIDPETHETTYSQPFSDYRIVS